ncbi:MAG: hypothetical protein WED81_03770, partial [Rhodothermales bacterium]
MLLWTGCDSGVPEVEPRVVIEGFLNTGSELPPIRISRTLSPNEPYEDGAAAVDDAEVEVTLGSTAIRYLPVSGAPGRYVPDESIPVIARSDFSINVRWSGSVATASGITPPGIAIERVKIEVPGEPVSAILLDSLALGDSLAVGARRGYIYPIEVTIAWMPDPEDEDLWIRAQLRPYTRFTSTVVDLFLRSDQISAEADFDVGADGLRSWTGVYAVGVEGVEDPLPQHLLRVALVRSGADYARFASTRHAPERREPISNVSGGIGIFTAISVDSTH